jgi:uncharacterized membrane protein
MNEIIKRPHPAIVHIPIGLFPVSVIFLLMYRALGNTSFLDASYWCFMFAVISIIPVAVTGWLDYIRLKPHSDEGHRLLKLHLRNGVLITALSVIAGWYFYMQSPLENENLLTPYTIITVMLSALVLAQGYLAAIMIYQHHIGIDGDTR